MVPDFAPGDPLDESTVMGAIVDAPDEDGAGLYRARQGGGARLLAGGAQARRRAAATIEADPVRWRGQQHAIAREEIFGPVLSVLSSRTWTRRCGRPTARPTACTAAVWTSDMSKAIRTSRALRAGTVHVNQYDSDDITVPFGGYKQSGNGRDKSLHAFDKYTELKTTWIQVRGRGRSRP
jgi:4-guanidinobutyraldehyde dehydrogenase/NAD-dependent aldehyde dehydrogenase